MSIWNYSDSTDKTATKQTVLRRPYSCDFCSSTMVRSHQWLDTSHLPEYFRTERYVFYCSECGWWVVREDRHGRDAAGAYAFTNIYGSIGILKELDVLDSSHPIDEIRQYLSVRYDRRKDVNPSVFEQVVASVYRDIGYKNVRVTGRSNDGGIDIVMEGPNDTLVGVQVKRYKERIQAEQIRAFTGALLLKGITSGIFLTTSDYTRGAQSTAALAGSRGYRIELVDSAGFYSALGLAQRNLYSGATDRTAPFYSLADMHHVDYKKAYLSRW